MFYSSAKIDLFFGISKYFRGIFVIFLLLIEQIFMVNKCILLIL